MGRSEQGKKAKYKYDVQYNKEHMKAYCCRLNLVKDKVIIDEIEKHDSFVAYVRELILKDINNRR